MVLFDPIQFHARLNPERPGLVALESRARELSYGEIACQVDAATDALLQVGIKLQQRVGVHCRDRLLHIVMVLALSRIEGTTLVFSPDGAFAHGVIDLLVSDAASRDPSLKTVVIDAAALSAATSERRDRISPAPAGKTIMLFTGTPAVSIGGHTLHARIAQRSRAKGTGGGSRWLCAADIHSELGLSAVTECLWVGGLAVLGGRRFEDDVEAIALYDVDRLLVDVNRAPTYLGTIGKTTGISGRLRAGVIAGAVPHEDTLHRMKRYVSPEAVVYLDLPETGAFAGCSFWQMGKPLRYWPLPEVDVRILGPDGEAIANGSPGFVAVRSEGNQRPLDRLDDGWFHSSLRGFLTRDRALVLSEASS